MNSARTERVVSMSLLDRGTAEVEPIGAQVYQPERGTAVAPAETASGPSQPTRNEIQRSDLRA